LRNEIEEFRMRWNRATTAVVSGTRNDADLSQEDIAKALKLSLRTVSRMEAGMREMTVADLALFARLTKTTPAALIDLITRWSSKIK
jgi:transcriptional regulator with XRE-family HTH domain